MSAQQGRPMVSIIIPTYQHARELPACLASVFAQNVTDFEVIVVNDGSTDGTEDAVRPFLDRITYVSQENRGGNAARNRGAAAANGEYLLFCDADIVMDPDFLQVSLDALAAHPEASYAYASFKFGWKTFRLHPFDADLLRQSNYIHTTSLMRRAHFPGFDESIRRLQDWDLWLTMLEQGHTGVWIPQVKFTAILHKGGYAISTWVPSILYRIPWRRLGLRMRAVEKFRAAEAIVKKKHGLPVDAETSGAGQPEHALSREGADDGFRRPFIFALLCITLFELLSYCAFVYPAFSDIAFLVIVGVTVLLASRRLDLAFLVLLAELCIGSQGGYLVSFGLEGGLNLSLRMGLFLAVGGMWLARWLASAVDAVGRAECVATIRALPQHPLTGPVVALAAVFVLGVWRGMTFGNGPDNVFFDANGYLYLALLPVFVSVVSTHRMRMAAAAVIAASVFTTTAKALFTEFVFSHRLFAIAKPLYVWIRDTRVGEITIMTGDFYRIFFQAHLFALFLLFVVVLQLAYAASWRTRAAVLQFGLVVATGSALLLSLSRSFWFGGAAAVLCIAAALIAARASFAVWRRLVTIAAIGLAAGAAVILLVYTFPFPQKGSDVEFGELFGRRAFSFAGEAAANSRWILLPELVKAGKEHPLLGAGLGREVTYRTEDPRLLADNPTGEYTTFAFEWGYHDLWVKFGALGLAAYAWFLWAVCAPWLRRVRAGLGAYARPFRAEEAGVAMSSVVALGVCAGLAALLATNVFSPYLNHPLGLGILMLAAAFAYGEKRPG